MFDLSYKEYDCDLPCHYYPNLALIPSTINEKCVAVPADNTQNNVVLVYKKYYFEGLL